MQSGDAFRPALQVASWHGSALPLSAYVGLRSDREALSLNQMVS